MIVTDYKFGVKKEVVEALRPIFGNTYPDEQLRNRVHVSTEYPVHKQNYPSVFVTFSESTIRNAGVGYYEVDLHDGDYNQKYKHFVFDGRINFHVLTLTPLDRDLLSAAIVNIIAFHPVGFSTFFNDIHDSDYVALQISHENVNPLGDTQMPVPWQAANEMIYGSSYSIDCLGEFWTDSESGLLMTIDQVNAYMYQTGDPEPTGTPDSAEWI